MFTIEARHTATDVTYPVRWIRYTPELAQQILDQNNKRNRSPKRNMVRKMVAAMKSGDFVTTHQGIGRAVRVRAATTRGPGAA